jgi:hypothetical protein
MQKIQTEIGPSVSSNDFPGTVGRLPESHFSLGDSTHKSGFPANAPGNLPYPSFWGTNPDKLLYEKFKSTSSLSLEIFPGI